MNIKSEKYENLQKKIVKHQILSKKNAETLVYSLFEIENSFHEIYDKILPDLLNENIEKNNFLDKLWDIREEMRHIEYHIKDGKLTEL